jgi:hypothetical protein
MLDKFFVNGIQVIKPFMSLALLSFLIADVTVLPGLVHLGFIPSGKGGDNGGLHPKRLFVLLQLLSQSVNLSL